MNVAVQSPPHSTVADKVTLTAGEQECVLDLAESLSADPTATPELFCATADSTARHLPLRIQDALRDFRRWGSATGTLLIEGMPLGNVPGTPPDNTSHLGENTVLGRAQALVDEAVGHMVAYEAEGFGRLFQDMVPTRAAAHTQTSLGSSTELELHTEQAFSALRPDYISLACLRGDENAETYTLTARQLDAALTPDQQTALRQNWWMTGIDTSFKTGGHVFDDEFRGPWPILDGAPDDPFIVFDQDLMTSANPAAAAAFDAAIEAYRRERNHHVLKPGDLLLIDNNRAVHGRSRFPARFTAHDRFVIRTFVVRDLSRSRFARPGDDRTIAARFS